ncbi:MAG: TOBE-like domain-containing protein, partial [Thermosynechococcaceae cyanobacterium]
DEVHVTSVFVTHDQEEAMEVADEIVIMNHGRIEQIGSPAEVYDHPATSFVMSFVGPVNVLQSNSKLFKDQHLDELKVNGPNCELFIRPHDIEVTRIANGTTVPATVQRIIHLGWEIQAELMLVDQQLVTAHLSREQFAELQLEPGQSVFAKPKTAKTFAVSAA